MQTKNTTIYVLSALLVLSIIGQMFLLGLKMFRVQNEVSNQSTKIEEIQDSVDKVLNTLQAYDVIIEK